MLNVFPFATGSAVTASYALSGSFAQSADFLAYVTTASVALEGPLGPRGTRGADVCLLTFEQYQQMLLNPLLVENCPFPPK